jgi:hypothetical protein
MPRFINIMAQIVTFWKLIDKQLVKPRLVLLASLDKLV